MRETRTHIRKFTALKLAIIALVAAGLFAFSSLSSGSIRGTVSPADGAVRAWAESSMDTLKAPVVSGAYEITGLKPGTYNIIIEATPPYRNAARNGVTVNDGQVTDAGEIKLEK